MIQGSVHEGRPLRRDDVWLRQAGSENVLFDPATRAVHLLNDTAMAIWHLCDGDTWPDEMIEVVCDVSRMHRDVVVEDIDRILSEFEASGLVLWVK